jgi:hypothetical protein
MQYIKVDWLNAADSIGATDPEQVQGASRYGVQRVTTGSPSTVNLLLQGSLDGSTWFTLLDLSTLGTPMMVWSDDDRPVAFVRLNLGALSGGSSPTVTASVIAFDA